MLTLILSSKHMCESLEKYGLTQNKTFTITFPNFLNEKLIPHFIRGYFDGDGTTSVFKRKDNGKVDCCISLMSSIQFCQGAKNFLETKNISMHINH